MPAKHDGFKDFVLDQLRALRGLTCRSMFDGYGLSCHGTFFGIVHNGRLYFKVSPATVASYQAHHMKPFRATAKMTLKTYYEVPTDILEDADQLVSWARQAGMLSQNVRRSRSSDGKKSP
jgi:DNA transformation protein